MEQPASESSPPSVYWREVVREGRASSYLVAGCPVPRADVPAGRLEPEGLVRSLAQAFFDGVTDSSFGLFGASYRADPAVDGGPPWIRDAALHPRGMSFLPLIRLGDPRLWYSPEHALLVYPVAGGPLAGRLGSTPEYPAAVSAETPPSGRDTSTDPRAAGVWDLGALAFEVLRFGGTLSLGVLVCDYPPRLIGSRDSLAGDAFYRLTQSPVHRWLVARFLQGAVVRLDEGTA